MSLMLVAALLAGIAGSAHCFGMCGGIASALAMRTRFASGETGTTDKTSIIGDVALHQAGRILGYATIGALGGTFGHSAHWLMGLARFESGLRLACGILTMLVAVRILAKWNAFAPLERAGAVVWRKIQPLAARAAFANRRFGALISGFAWGWLPCGLVYSMLLIAMTTTNALEGACVMIAFGAGTLPGMAGSFVFSAWPNTAQRPWLRRTTGLLILSFGAWMVIGSQLAHIAHSHAG